MSKFFGITRERVFSPGKVEDDSAILEAVAGRLRQAGHAVSVFHADEPEWPDPTGISLVFSMAQGAVALERMREWQARSIRIVNRPEAILNCQRHRTIAALTGAGVPFPESHLIDTSAGGALPEWIGGGAWVKRGDVHATEAGDVVRVDSVVAARAVLQRLHQRGIHSAVVQRHVGGTVLKFYAVRQRFFFCVTASSSWPLPASALERIAALGERAARALDVEVYGGDCVYDAQGGLCLIDLNDWPSYVSCRTQAAMEIATYLQAHKASTRW